jgi:hypothetical protein
MSSNNPGTKATAEERRKKEATTDKTLSDIEETEDVPEPGKPSKDDVPTPDAQPQDRARETDDAGPM